MKKQYFVWKDPACNGIAPEWVELTGSEFYRLIKAEENKSRRFVTLCDGGDAEAATIVIESTPEYYKGWHKEHQRDYRHAASIGAQNVILCSLEELVAHDDDCTFAELLTDESQDILGKILLHDDIQRVRKLLTSLTQKEFEIVNALYLDNPNCLSDREIARKLGLPQKTLFYWKRKIFEKSKNFLAQN